MIKAAFKLEKKFLQYFDNMERGCFCPPPPQKKKHPRSMFQSVDTFEANRLKYADRVFRYICMSEKCHRCVIQYGYFPHCFTLSKLGQ